VNAFLYLERELLGAIRVQSAVLLSFALLSLFLFLASFACLFLLPTASALSPGTIAANEVRAYVSPQLTVAAIEGMAGRLQARADVRSVQLRTPSLEEVKPNRTGRRFTLVASSAAAVPGLVAALQSMEGIASVEIGPAGGAGRIALSEGGRIGLLCGLAVCALLALVLARQGFRALLYAFRHEIRLMRLAGVSERRILSAVGVTGLLMGLLAGALVVVGLVLYGVAVADAAPVFDATRLAGVVVATLVLGVLMGGLIGLLGAAHLASNRFSPIP
jgi:cell division protein FtsX